MELIVVLALLALIIGISGLALASLTPPRESETIGAIRHARAEAIRGGVSTTVTVLGTSVLLLPDGRAVGVGIDPLTGSVRAGR